jgi:hypothetical protein
MLYANRLQVAVADQQQGRFGRILNKAGGRPPTLLNTGEAFYNMADGSGAYDEGELPSSEVEFRDWVQVGCWAADGWGGARLLLCWRLGAGGSNAAVALRQLAHGGAVATAGVAALHTSGWMGLRTACAGNGPPPAAACFVACWRHTRTTPSFDAAKQACACCCRVQARVEEGASDTLRMINFNFAWPYHQDLGLFVAVDGAANIARSLPAAALISTTPPGSFYSVRTGACWDWACQSELGPFLCAWEGRGGGGGLLLQHTRSSTRGIAGASQEVALDSGRPPPLSVRLPLQDVPLVDDVKVTLDYDMAALQSAPRWTDDLQQYVDLHSDPALAIIVGGWRAAGGGRRAVHGC